MSSWEQDRRTGMSYRAQLIPICLTLCFTELRFQRARDGNEVYKSNAAGACSWEAHQLQNRLYSALPNVRNFQHFIRCFDNCIYFRLQVPTTVCHKTYHLSLLVICYAMVNLIILLKLMLMQIANTPLRYSSTHRPTFLMPSALFCNPQ